MHHGERGCLNLIYKCCNYVQTFLLLFSKSMSQKVFPNSALNQGPHAPEARLLTTALLWTTKVCKMLVKQAISCKTMYFFNSNFHNAKKQIKTTSMADSVFILWPNQRLFYLWHKTLSKFDLFQVIATWNSFFKTDKNTTKLLKMKFWSINLGRTVLGHQIRGHHGYPFICQKNKRQSQIKTRI